MGRKGYRIAVVGAAGNVGREILATLAARDFPAGEVIALAPAAGAGREVSYGDDRVLAVQDVARFDFRGTDIVLAAAGTETAAAVAPKAAAAGAVVIDTTAHWRMDPDVPLVVPEVNPQALAGFARKRIVASPNGAAIALAMALKPLHDIATVRRVVVATYQAVSAAGKEAMDELFNQTRAIYVNDPVEASVFPKQIAFNVIPQIDRFMEDGTTREEWKLMVETKKVLDPRIKVAATCVRVPVFIGHAAAVTAEFADPVEADAARHALRDAPGIVVMDRHEPGGYITPAEATGDDAVYVSRVREDVTVENGLSFWCATDNLRKGSALNAVQIAELLVQEHLGE
ncbi:aspartate-semialdehyde dehydrogenase [Azospirillum sp. ST 5-10]|uniref:aspartate-semialdehyde dehydrogenase n=1 Tax=unclassified Azospirillum TaxID=2630922 RepID=UPI003F49C9D7